MTDPVYAANEDRYQKMSYRRCGRSGIDLPKLSLGLWYNFGSLASFDNVKKMAHFAFDNGICHFDLANNYGPAYGTAEENFGRLMASSFRPYRDELFISTKAGWDMWPGPYGNWGSRKYLMASLDQSLRRMNLDYVDVFYSHRHDPATPIEETMQALVDIVRSGKALYVGLSRYPKDKMEQAFEYLKSRDVPCLLYQDRYNIIDRGPQKRGLLDVSHKNGTGFISFSPLQQGLLTDRYLNGIPGDSRIAGGKSSLKKEALTPEMLKALNALNGLAAKRGESLAGMALAWLLADERVSSVIIGASSAEQIAINLKALGSAPFSSEELELIDSVSSPIQLA